MKKSYCRYPQDCTLTEEDHGYCWANFEGHECFGGLSEQHWPKRSQGGKVVVAILCAGVHDAIDNGMKYQGRRLSNDTVTEGEARYYRILDRDAGEILVKRFIAGTIVLRIKDNVSEDARTPYAEWESEGEALFHARRKAPWAEGDWLVEGEKQFGDLYVQGWSRLGLQQSAVDQRINMAAAFPEKHRVPDASWSHHRAVITVTPREEQRSWLLAAVRNGWSDREFKQALVMAEVLTPQPKKRTIITCPACKHKAPREDYGHENVQ